VKPERPLMNYYGGKWNLAPWIISHMPPHEAYIEVFGGALSVFMQKEPCRLEVVNDKDLQIASLYRHVRHAAHHLALLLDMTPYSRHEYYSAKQREESLEGSRQTIVASYMGVGNSLSDSSNGFRNSKTSNTSPARSWPNYVDQFERFHNRLRGAIIECLDFEILFEKYNKPNTLWYLDPPYVFDTRTDQQAGRAYCYEMTDQDHERLLTLAQGLSGMVLLSGYDHPLYESLPWKKVQCEARTQRNSVRIESLWVNPLAVQNASQRNLFETEPEKEGA
jgi:DNA adenine methylase